MAQTLFSIFTWLHALATVIFIGHFVLLSLLYLPAFAKANAEIAGSILSDVSKRSRPWMYGSLLIFMVTGIYLMIVDPNYRGVGDFGNPWAIAMLLKHVLIVAMIGMGFFYNAILRVGPMMNTNNSAEAAIARFGLYAKLMAIWGTLVLLLTAFAQFE